ncbi:hypothetical protein TNCV_4814661 [Trichonephila clavipes]|nr:hypothetical protein TNCV_4814661 [Trichonephila clavipes]
MYVAQQKKRLSTPALSRRSPSIVIFSMLLHSSWFSPDIVGRQHDRGPNVDDLEISSYLTLNRKGSISPMTLHFLEGWCSILDNARCLSVTADHDIGRDRNLRRAQESSSSKVKSRNKEIRRRKEFRNLFGAADNCSASLFGELRWNKIFYIKKKSF